MLQWKFDCSVYIAWAQRLINNFWLDHGIHWHFFHRKHCCCHWLCLHLFAYVPLLLNPFPIKEIILYKNPNNPMNLLKIFEAYFCKKYRNIEPRWEISQVSQKVVLHCVFNIQCYDISAIANYIRHSSQFSYVACFFYIQYHTFQTFNLFQVLQIQTRFVIEKPIELRNPGLVTLQSYLYPGCLTIN